MFTFLLSAENWREKWPLKFLHFFLLIYFSFPFLQDKPFTCVSCAWHSLIQHTAQCKPDYCHPFRLDFKLKQSKITACSCVLHSRTHALLRLERETAVCVWRLDVFHDVFYCTESDSHFHLGKFRLLLGHQFTALFNMLSNTNTNSWYRKYMYTYIQIKATPSFSDAGGEGRRLNNF